MSKRGEDDFSRYFIPAKQTKTVWQKKAAVKFEIKDDGVVCRPMRRHAVSPTDPTEEPQWSIDFHAREEGGRPVISAMMVCTPVEFAMVIGIVLAGFAAQVGLDVLRLARGVATGAKEAAGLITEKEE